MADNEKFNQIIAELKALREEKKISLEKISKKTHIRLQYLQYLEHGELEKLPHVYDRFIFKTYLSELRVENPEKYLTLFDEMRAPLKKTTSMFSKKTNKNIGQEEKKILSKTQMLKLLYFGIPIFVVILVVVILLQHQSSAPSESKTPVKELTAQEIVKQVKEKAQKKAMALQQKKSQQSLKIHIKASDKSWIRYVKDHADTADFILKTNNFITITADSVVEFKIGNPASLTFQVDSIEYKSLAKPGQVISYMKVTPKGIVAKRVVVPKFKRKVKNDSTKTQ